jgi:ribonucleotide reductase alpha subunit
MKITRRFTKAGQDALASVEYEQRTSRISNPDGSIVFEMNDAEIPRQWSQLATDIMVSKYFRKAGVPQKDAAGNPLRDGSGNIVTGPERSVKEVVNRLAGCWRYWGEKNNYFDNAEDAQAFYDEIAYMLLHQMCAPNSPQWFNTGLNFAYGITGPAQGHYYCDPRSGELMKGKDAYSHPQPHACFIQAVSDDLVNAGGIMDLWTREARLFKYGSGTGSNFSRLRGENEPLSGGGKSSGLMSFLKIGDRAAGAIKSGGTTRRAAKMCCLDLDHPDVEAFVNWKVREELKVAALAEGLKRLPKESRDLAAKLGLKLDYDFNGEAYMTVSGQNSNNSVRIPNRFFKAVEEDSAWNLTWRTSGKVAKTIKAQSLWDQIAFAAWRCADPGVQYDDTINQWHTCPASGRINASNPCVTADTRVLTPGGIWRRIDQMIHLPARIVTNLNDHEIHSTEGSFPTGVKEVFELRTAGGYSIKLTGDHKLWTRQRGWVPACELTTSDEIKLTSQPAAVQEIGEPQDDKFFQLLGLFVSSANGGGDALRLDACLGNSEQVEPLAKYVAKNWSDRSYEDDYVNSAMICSEESSVENIGGTATVALTNRRLLSRLKAYVRQETGARRLGDDAFTAGLAAQKHLLRGLFSADATVYRGSLQLAGDSIGLLEDIQLLLLGFGVQSAIVDLAGNNLTGNNLIANDSGAVELGSLSESFSGDGGAIAGGGSVAGGVECAAGAEAAFGGSPERRTPTSTPMMSEKLISLTGQRAGRADAETRRHGLRIDSGSLRAFSKHIGLLPGKKLEQLATAVSFTPVSGGAPSLVTSSFNASRFAEVSENFDFVSTLTPLGRQQVFDLTERVTHSFVANGITVHNCSEYMFLDDTACNLASLNVLTFFDAETRRFDIEGYKHAIRLWTIVLEISVLMASFPSEEIAKRSYRYRTLGLGYANLGAMLMQAGIAYDTEKGRAICAALSAILTGESYAASAEMAGELGAFAGYEPNKSHMLRVIRNHRRAAYDATSNAAAKKSLGDYETLDIKPVGMDAGQFAGNDPLASVALMKTAQECWDRALMLGERHGYRNAQTTVIAPTGTIGLLMDCDTTGVEPDFALVKFKKLAGGGYFKIANQSLRPALINLGYTAEQIHDILRYVMGTITLHDAPHINFQSLRHLGFTKDELERIEESLPAQFEIAFAFSPWTVGAETLKRLNIPEATWQAPGFNLLQHLGFSRKQINEANDVICGHGTVENAPHLREEHYPVFDCANKCGKHGVRFIAVEGHIRMMAAAQPFISGAISKTINLPNEATLEDIKSSYYLSWQLGLKANALYRDGSKLSQPLNVKSDEELEKVEDDDEENVEAARKEVTEEVVQAAHALFRPTSSDNLAPANTHIVEKIVERIVERPLRRRLPDTRHATTHKFDVAGHEGYITVGLYEDGSPGEIFIRMAKEGSTIGGLMDTIATLVSVSLQYGVPVESLVRKFEHVRFEPSGMTRNSEIPFAKSLVDYIFRWLAMEFVHGYRAANAPKRERPVVEGSAAPAALPPATAGPMQSPQSTDSAVTPAPVKKSGNGHGPRIAPDDTKPFAYSEEEQKAAKSPQASTEVSYGANLRLAIVGDPLSQQGTEMQADAPACDVCGSITVRSGTCYKCLNCGNSMGCS